jgi:hypothetical protein
LIKGLLQAGSKVALLFSPLSIPFQNCWRCFLQGDVEGIEAALAAGVPPDAEDGAGFTALISACRHGHLAAANALIRAKADIHAHTLKKNTALMYASQFFCCRLLTRNLSSLFVALYRGFPTRYAITGGKEPIIDLLLDKVQLETRNSLATIPLSHARVLLSMCCRVLCVMDC